jgi:glycine/D-amino acid oxidase-like deaminating enzyme
VPNDDQTCGWLATLPPLPAARRLVAPTQADCVVIGAGFTGVAAARQLARHQPQWRIVILEAQRVGGGASGRNSGFVVDVSHYQRAWGVEANRRMVRLGRAGVAYLRDLVRTHAIDCAWTEGGRLHAGTGSAGTQAVDHFASGLDELGEPYERLDAAAMAEVTGTSFYRAGVRTPGGALIQPAALVRGLAASLPDNVELYELSAVRTIRGNGPFRVDAGDARVTAGRVILATNGYTPTVGALRRHVFPMWTFGSLTRPLSTAEQAALGGSREWGVVSELQMGATVRRTRDQRILIRNTVHYSGSITVTDDVRRRARDNHRRSLAVRFPQLSGVELEYTWGGVMGVTFNNAPVFARIADHVFVAGAYNGVGVALGSIAGTLLADSIVGAHSALLDDIRQLPAAPWVPPEPLLGIGVRATLKRLRARAAEEQ